MANIPKNNYETIYKDLMTKEDHDRSFKAMIGALENESDVVRKGGMIAKMNYEKRHSAYVSVWDETKKLIKGV